VFGARTPSNDWAKSVQRLAATFTIENPATRSLW